MYTIYVFFYMFATLIPEWPWACQDTERHGDNWFQGDKWLEGMGARVPLFSGSVGAINAQWSPF